MLALVALAASLLGLVRCSADRAAVDAPGIPAVSTAVIPGAGAAAAPTVPVAGSLTAGADSLFDHPRPASRPARPGGHARRRLRGEAGVAAADGAEQLTREGAHLEVDPTQVTVVGAG